MAELDRLAGSVFPVVQGMSTGSCSSAAAGQEEQGTTTTADVGEIRPRTDSEGFMCAQSFTNYSGKLLGLKKESADDGSSTGQECVVSMHKLNTEGHVAFVSYPPEERYDAVHHGASPSPPPLSEPVFEPYVICTKTRSETSCSNESQFSSSSNEPLGEGGGLCTPHQVDVVQDCSLSQRNSKIHPPLSRHNISSNSSGGASLEYLGAKNVETLLERVDEFDDEPASLFLTEPGGPTGENEEGETVTVLISPNHQHEPCEVLCRTRPVRPPQREDSSSEEKEEEEEEEEEGDGDAQEGESRTIPFASRSSPLNFPTARKTTENLSMKPQSVPNPTPLPPHETQGSASNLNFQATLGTQRARAVTFLQCKVGEESGCFTADYLGMKEVDMYIKSVNLVAKELASNQPKEIQVFVASERIRFAPPNSPTLFRSFSVKDVLLVRKCSKNKRIIGIMVWKQQLLQKKVGVASPAFVPPTCHILRCQDQLVADSLYDALRQQTQKVDDVPSSNKPSRRSSGNGHKSLTRTLSDETSLSTTSSNSSSGSLLRGPSPSLALSSAATECLHEFPAIYIGSTTCVKSSSLQAIIERVLMESQPSQAKPVSVSLSLMEVRYTLDEGGVVGSVVVGGVTTPSVSSKQVLMTHETSRVRTMGAYAEDRRFAGYVIKEEGLPMMAHVIKCNSAALMVSFTSFLRQSCQLTAHQRGGAFYEELSTDESGEWGVSTEVPASNTSPSLMKRFKSLTSSISQFTSLSSSPSSSSRASFQSHMHHRVNKYSTSKIKTGRPLETGQTTPPSSGEESPVLRRKGADATPTSPHEFSEDEFARFQVTYIGSATQEDMLTQQSVEDAMQIFAESGTAAGQAAVTKNTVHFQVSSVGINLTDKSRKLFIHRNYPLKSLAGYCRHPSDPKLFAVASYRPGFPNIKRVHVFKCGEEPVEQVLDAIKYWIKRDPVVDTPTHDST